MSQHAIPIAKTPISFDGIKALVGRDDPIILDVGSNDGTHTNEFLKTFPAARVYSFEPDPRAIAKWRRKVTSERATLFEGALGATTGKATFHTSTGQLPGRENDPRFTLGYDASGSLRAPKSHLTIWPWVKFETTLPIEVARLDDWSAANGIHRIDFIWADVQGAEGDLIDGGQETLKRARYFYTEYSDRECYEGQITLAEMTKRLEGDFEMVARWDVDVLFRNRAYGESPAPERKTP